MNEIRNKLYKSATAKRRLKIISAVTFLLFTGLVTFTDNFIKLKYNRFRAISELCDSSYPIKEIPKDSVEKALVKY